MGAVYWRAGAQRATQNDVLNILGAIFVAQIFLGTSNSSTIQPVVAVERGVFNRFDVPEFGLADKCMHPCKHPAVERALTAPQSRPILDEQHVSF